MENWSEKQITPFILRVIVVIKRAYLPALTFDFVKTFYVTIKFSPRAIYYAVKICSYFWSC